MSTLSARYQLRSESGILCLLTLCIDFWVVGLSLLASVLLYASAGGQLAYIDALFFAAGANTQAGLNPVDVNLLNTFQQIVIMICSMISNPIAINTFVVFLRLFWFEKKFQDMVREARNRRSTITKTKSMAQPENVQSETGVNGRDIRVMRDGTMRRVNNDLFVLSGAGGKDPTGESSSGVSPTATLPGEAEEKTVPDERGPGITFAGTVKRSDGMQDEMLKGPRRLTDEEHIAILQRQRNTDNVDNEEVLHIPGPRDVELGERPRRVEGRTDDDPEPLTPGLRRGSEGEAQTPARPKGITIQEPAKKPTRKEEISDDAKAFLNVFTPFKLRKPRMLDKEDNTHHHGSALSQVKRQTFDTIRGALSRDKNELAPYLSWQPTLGRNSAFVGELSDEQREELGGIEYRSLKTLSVILMMYFWGFWIFSMVCLTPWIIYTERWGRVVDGVGQSRAWWGIFTGSSAFTDLGFTLTPDSMNSFNTAVFPLLLMSFLIVIGNTGFPVMLRFIIWVTSLWVPKNSGLWAELRFLLDHPRRCFTLLFPSAATWWLFWLLVILNGIDLIFFIILDVSIAFFIKVSDITNVFRSLGQAWLQTSPQASKYSMVHFRPSRPEQLGLPA